MKCGSLKRSNAMVSKGNWGHMPHAVSKDSCTLDPSDQHGLARGIADRRCCLRFLCYICLGIADRSPCIQFRAKALKESWGFRKQLFGRGNFSKIADQSGSIGGDAANVLESCTIIGTNNQLPWVRGLPLAVNYPPNLNLSLKPLTRHSAMGVFCTLPPTMANAACPASARRQNIATIPHDGHIIAYLIFENSSLQLITRG